MAAVCHAYGFTPGVVLAMPFRHFLLLASERDALERRRALYTALAFHDPKQLQQDSEAVKTIRATKKNSAEVLRMVNGR